MSIGSLSLQPSTIDRLRRFSRIRAIPFGIRDRVLRRLVSPDGTCDHPFVEPFFGRRYPGNLNRFIDWVVYFYGAYEPGLLGFLRDAAALSGTSAVYVDVGANVGHHVLFMADRVDAVHAFEPYPPVAALLEEKIRLNALRNVTLHPVGLGAVSASLPYFPPAGGNTGTGNFLASVGPPAIGALPIMKGDDYFDKNRIAKVDLLKIDVEGYELPVLDGLAGTIRRDRPIVVVEWTSMTVRRLADAKKTLPDFLPPDYRIFGLFSRGDRDYRLRPDDYSCSDLVLCPAEVSRLPLAGQTCLS